MLHALKRMARRLLRLTEPIPKAPEEPTVTPPLPTQQIVGLRPDAAGEKAGPPQQPVRARHGLRSDRLLEVVDVEHGLAPSAVKAVEERTPVWMRSRGQGATTLRGVQGPATEPPEAQERRDRVAEGDGTRIPTTSVLASFFAEDAGGGEPAKFAGGASSETKVPLPAAPRAERKPEAPPHSAAAVLGGFGWDD